MKGERYETVEDIPETLGESLPEQAKQIYLEAYQENWDKLDEEDVEKTGGEMDRSSISHRNAMHAVYEVYVHDEDSGEWRKRGEEREEGEEEGILEDIKDTIAEGVEDIKKTLQ